MGSKNKKKNFKKRTKRNSLGTQGKSYAEKLMQRLDNQKTYHSQ